MVKDKKSEKPNVNKTFKDVSNCITDLLISQAKATIARVFFFSSPVYTWFLHSGKFPNMWPFKEDFISCSSMSGNIAVANETGVEFKQYLSIIFWVTIIQSSRHSKKLGLSWTLITNYSWNLG